MKKNRSLYATALVVAILVGSAAPTAFAGQPPPPSTQTVQLSLPYPTSVSEENVWMEAEGTDVEVIGSGTCLANGSYLLVSSTPDPLQLNIFQIKYVPVD